MYPITLQSIHDTHGPDGKGKFPSVFVKAYSAFAILVLIGTIAVQWFWLAGATMVSDVRSGIEQYDDLTVAIIKKEEGLRKASRQMTDGDAEKLYADMETLFGRLVADGQSLHVWNEGWARYTWIEPPFKQAAYGKMDTPTRTKTDVASAALFLQALASYVLPMLYGLLGSIVYVIRSISQEITHCTFTFESSWRYVLRLALGPLAGIAIGLLIVPDMSSEAAQSPHLLVLATLSPMALAFVAGYGVELVFALLDKIIFAFVGPGRRPGQKIPDTPVPVNGDDGAKAAAAT